MSTAATKIRYYNWRGTNQAGRKVSGTTLGFQEQEVRHQLVEQKIVVKKIKKTSPSFLTKMRDQMKGEDVTAVTRQLATMIESGVPVVQALQLMASSYNKAEMRATLLQITTQVESGASLSSAMRSSSPLFDKFFCDLVATGEQTGHLGQVFARIAVYREKNEAMRKKVIKAMIYPAMVTLTAVLVTVLMLVFVIPQFAQIFSSFGAELPLFTQLVVHASDFLIAYGVYLGAGVGIAVFLYRYFYKKSDDFRYKANKFALKLPIFGDVLLKATIARFARTLATTFMAGIPLLSGIQSAGRTCGNLYIEKAIEEVYESTAGGMPLYLALRQSGVFPELMLQMVMIGEESGSLDDMLNKMAQIYEADVDNTVDNLGQILEPFIIIILGGLIGGLLVAMYMPIFTLMSVIG
ncbi:type II secretion system F family protein [Photobacterium angustum]|uniref:Type II secretion system F family protein n=1 Tax=Photobacterium angustum TaxID=661 RepID=A0A855SFY7_PHOAN|nr:type II secretion system F family protein [Photobacterium angustum]KJF81191.1 type II secretion system protein F [Photobacterium damselae subsp. damselae]KJG39342.1 type II secretion system protein F [Photobacterium angustum]KJG44703.1 type II secretion system protein F [Photobacterium angustum]KJG48379.1 type II secretion system protein F [Photobacterium angustum]KJG52103.1 type II secretion system protein F [Photobacterium angustum]